MLLVGESRIGKPAFWSCNIFYARFDPFYAGPTKFATSAKLLRFLTATPVALRSPGPFKIVRRSSSMQESITCNRSTHLPLASPSPSSKQFAQVAGDIHSDTRRSCCLQPKTWSASGWIPLHCTIRIVSNLEADP